uniref:NPL domain-containing protein n=1 Tax=Rhabditophanes sp. KR3021 TaxID=114890 RepID=A0AC35TU61_9BILA
MLNFSGGETIKISYVQLPKATYAKFKPQSVRFLDLTDPKVVLATELAKYVTFSQGDIFTFFYSEEEYAVEVTELKPAKACCVADCDLNVEFEAPTDYVEPVKINTEMPKAPELPLAKVILEKQFGHGNRLGGIKKSRERSKSSRKKSFTRNDC